MLGILVEIALNWLLLWAVFKANLSALGIRATKARGIYVAEGLLLAGVLCSAYFLSKAIVADVEFSLNPNYDFLKFLNASYWVFKSILFEELIFRAALLYVAIRKLGVHKACILSAVAFGIYHWFSYGLWGNPVMMIYIFLLTGLFGLFLAYSFARSHSILIPISWHLGWNFTNIIVFSQGPIGEQLLLATEGFLLSDVWQLIFTLAQILIIPAAGFIYLKIRFRKTTNQ